MPPRSSEEEEGRRAEEGIWDQRETSHPSPARYLAAVRPAGALHLQNYDGRPIFQIRYKFGRGVRKRRRRRGGDREGDFFESLRENRQINLGRPARTSICANVATPSIGWRKGMSSCACASDRCCCWIFNVYRDDIDT